MQFAQRLSQPLPLILDGATGTELDRRGVDTGLPMWSANALLSDEGQSILKGIHADYLRAGAEILTANTFRTHRRALLPSGKGDRALELTRRAVEIARAAIAEAGDSAHHFVAGSISTLEDCYRPDLVPSDAECRTEHSERVQHLLEAGVDILLIETMNSIREAAIAAKLAAITGTPVMVSFVCDLRGRILSGESFTDAARELEPLGVTALGANCGPAAGLRQPLEELKGVCGPDFPLIAYANIGYADDRKGWINTDAEDPETYCSHAVEWPARIVGGCCGTRPAHIARLRARLHSLS